MAQNPLLLFGPFDLDPVTLELRRDGVALPLEPLPARVLVRLAERAGSMVSRRELLECGWPEPTDAGAQSLNTCIYQIRHALGSHDDGVVLETLRARGYRLRVDGPTPSARIAPARPRVLAAAAIGTLIAFAIGVTLVAGRWSGMRSIPPDAGRLLEQARYLAEDTQDLIAAHRLLDSARIRFPATGLVHAEWAELSLRLGQRDAAVKAVALAMDLNDRLATAYRVSGGVALLDGEWAAADVALERARSLDPRDTRTLALLAFGRTIQGRFGEAGRLMGDAARLDPLSGPVRQDAGMLHLLAGQYAAAERACRETLRFKPGSVWATDCLFDATGLAGRVEDAATWGRELLRLQGGREPDAAASPREVVAAVEAWRLDRWIEAVERGAYPYGLALAYAANGLRQDAIRALWAAAERPQLGLLSIAVDPRFATLRNDAGFGRLLDRLKLAGVANAHHSGD